MWKSSAVYPNDITEKQYEKVAALAQLIEGKSIAYVCTARNIVGKGMGEFIDSHDIVVRAGAFNNPTDEMQRDYGTRTDILVHSFNEPEIAQFRKNIPFLLSLKYILCAMVSTNFLAEHEQFFNELRNEGKQVENVDDDVLFPMFRQVGTICNVGFAGLLILLKYDIKEIYLTGMSFYNMGTYGNIYTDDHYNSVVEAGIYKRENGRRIHGDFARQDLHDQPSQINYLRELIKHDKRIKLDSYLTENL